MLRLLLVISVLVSLPVGAADSLPRVLILGDGVYREPARNAASILKGRVEIVWRSIEPGEIRSSETALKSVDRWLGDETWDLIHFNFGLGDLLHRAPGLRAFRVLPKPVGGVRATSPKQYEQNLTRLVARLKKTGAKLVWASTTPIRHSSTKVFELKSEIEYNAIAAKVMTAHGVPVNDMYSYVLQLIDMNKPASHGADPFSFDRNPLYPAIVRSVLTELDLLRPVRGPVKVFVSVGGWSHIGGGYVAGSKAPRPGQARGTLDELVLRDGSKHRHLVNEDGSWSTRADVWVQFDRRGPKSGALGVGYGGDRKRGIGPELAVGHALGNHFEEQVFLLKTTLGNPSLATDLRPPSSGKTGKWYVKLQEQIRESLSQLGNKFPDYTKMSRFELAGLVLHLGESEKDDAKVYSEYLPLLIEDLRKDLKVKDLPVVLVGPGLGGREETKYSNTLQAQQAFASLPKWNRVSYVETRDFWPPEGARDSWRHSKFETWYDNAESFYQIGQAIGGELLRLLQP
ncbi:MAG: sialate O-acetylesterase [Planctomycetota bacterium]